MISVSILNLKFSMLYTAGRGPRGILQITTERIRELSAGRVDPQAAELCPVRSKVLGTYFSGSKLV
jgi:hypothetical protein